jgi:hypothetical protein
VSDEISLAIRFTFEKGGTAVSFPDGTAREMSIDVSGSRYVRNRQQVGTSEEALELGDIATGGYFVARNCDDTNYVEIRSGTGATDLVRLNAGEVCCFRLSSDAAAPYVIANTAAVELEYVLVQA